MRRILIDCIFIGFVLMVFQLLPSAHALKGGLPEAVVRITALEGMVAQLQSDLLKGNNVITELGGRLNCIRREVGAINGLAGPHVIFEGCNVHVRSGSGATNDNTFDPENPNDPTGTLTGLGNLIVGYNEGIPIDPTARGGSHNLIVGPEHRYSRFGGFVAGRGNTISGPHASVSGGQNNRATGDQASVSGGIANEATGNHGSVSGGFDNEASGASSSVSGGERNVASGPRSSVSGGDENEAIGSKASVTGGRRNEASGLNSSVSGGQFNEANCLIEFGNTACTVSGGQGNEARHEASTVSGGRNLSTTSDFQHLP